jgi:hypothetical protein
MADQQPTDAAQASQGPPVKRKPGRPKGTFNAPNHLAGHPRKDKDPTPSSERVSYSLLSLFLHFGILILFSCGQVQKNSNTRESKPKLARASIRDGEAGPLRSNVGQDGSSGKDSGVRDARVQDGTGGTEMEAGPESSSQRSSRVSLSIFLGRVSL